MLVTLYFHSVKSVQGMHIHRSEARGREKCRIQQHWTTDLERLLPDREVKIINKLPGHLKLLIIKNQFKTPIGVNSILLCQRLQDVLLEGTKNLVAMLSRLYYVVLLNILYYNFLWFIFCELDVCCNSTLRNYWQQQYRFIYLRPCITCLLCYI